MIYLSTNKAIFGCIGAVFIVILSFLLGTFVSRGSETEIEHVYYRNLINSYDEPFVDILEKQLDVNEMKRHLE
jgi:hypothetical protein